MSVKNMNNNKKYELTKKYIEITEDKIIKVYRIRALKSFTTNTNKIILKGELGGFVQSEYNLSQTGNCWIGNTAIIFEQACVFENALVYENAIIRNSARIYGNSSIFGHAFIAGNVDVYGKAIIYGTAEITDETCVFGDVTVCGRTRIVGNSIVDGKSELFRTQNDTI